MKENSFCDSGENIVGDLNHITLGCKMIKHKFDKFIFKMRHPIVLPINLEFLLFCLFNNKEKLSKIILKFIISLRL